MLHSDFLGSAWKFWHRSAGLSCRRPPSSGQVRPPSPPPSAELQPQGRDPHQASCPDSCAPAFGWFARPTGLSLPPRRSLLQQAPLSFRNPLWGLCSAPCNLFLLGLSSTVPHQSGGPVTLDRCWVTCRRAHTVGLRQPCLHLGAWIRGVPTSPGRRGSLGLSCL